MALSQRSLGETPAFVIVVADVGLVAASCCPFICKEDLRALAAPRVLLTFCQEQLPCASPSRAGGEHDHVGRHFSRRLVILGTSAARDARIPVGAKSAGPKPPASVATYLCPHLWALIGDALRILSKGEGEGRRSEHSSMQQRPGAGRYVEVPSLAPLLPCEVSCALLDAMKLVEASAVLW